MIQEPLFARRLQALFYYVWGNHLTILSKAIYCEAKQAVDHDRLGILSGPRKAHILWINYVEAITC